MSIAFSIEGDEVTIRAVTTLITLCRRTRTGARGDQRDADPVRRRQPLAEKENAEYGNENDAQLVERRDACRVAEFQGSEVAQPGCARGEA